MINIRNKNGIYLVLFSALVLLVVALLVIYNGTAQKSENISNDDRKSYEEVLKTAKKNNPLEVPLPSDSFDKENFLKTSEVIDKNYTAKALVINYDSKLLRERLDLVKELIENGKYVEAERELVSIEKALDDSAKRYIEENTDNIKNINVSLTSSGVSSSADSYINHKIVVDWAIVAVSGVKGQIDDSVVILKRENGVWIIKEGPTTDPDTDILKNMGVPKEILDSIYDLPVIKII